MIIGMNNDGISWDYTNMNNENTRALINKAVETKVTPDEQGLSLSKIYNIWGDSLFYFFLMKMINGLDLRKLRIFIHRKHVLFEIWIITSWFLIKSFFLHFYSLPMIPTLRCLFNLLHKNKPIFFAKISLFNYFKILRTTCLPL